MRLPSLIPAGFHGLIVSLLCVPFSMAGELDAVRREVRQSSGPLASASPTSTTNEKPKRKSKPSRDYCDDFDEEEGFFEAIFADMFSLTLTAGAVGVGVAATSPYWVPRNWIEERSNAITYLRADPYASEPYGFLLIDQMDGEMNHVYSGASWGGQVSVDYSSDFDDIQAIGGDLRVEHRSRFGLESRWRTLDEDIGNSSDSLTVGAVNGIYRFAQSPQFAMRSGIGLNWLVDDVGSEFGFNWVYSAEWTPMKPLVVRGGIELGTLGDAFTTHASLFTGLQKGRWQLYAGPEFFSFDDATITLLTTGIAVRF